MIIDEKGRLFGKVSIIDIAVIILILLAVVGAIFSFITVKDGKKAPSADNLSVTESQLNNICVEFELLNTREINKNAIAVKDKIYSAETGKYIGEITQIYSKPHQEAITGTDGTMVFADVPEKYDITVYVKISGYKTDNGFYTSDNIHLALGDTMSFKTEIAEISPAIKKVYFITEENAAQTAEMQTTEDTKTN